VCESRSTPRDPGEQSATALAKARRQLNHARYEEARRIAHLASSRFQQEFSPELAFRFRYFALRRMHVPLRAGALVAFPGGYSTLDELYEALTLVPTGKVARIRIVLVGSECWRCAVDSGLPREGGIYQRPGRAPLFTRVDAAEEIVAVLEAFYGGEPPGLEAVQG
jgi:predicted Rossmann-fold nucleotide-binding protein